jgi:hypothetical protein
MKSLRAVLVTSVLAAAALSVPAGAHPADLVASYGKAGPIRRGATTMSDMRTWFGDPTSRERIKVGCVEVMRARWGGKLTVYTSTEAPRTVEAIFVRNRSIDSDEHGRLDFHTGRDLRVGDREGRLRRLYPGADPITHAGHTHYRLRTARNGGYLMGKVVGDKVIRLELWPYEFC